MIEKHLATLGNAVTIAGAILCVATGACLAGSKGSAPENSNLYRFFATKLTLPMLP